MYYSSNTAFSAYIKIGLSSLKAELAYRSVIFAVILLILIFRAPSDFLIIVGSVTSVAFLFGYVVPYVRRCRQLENIVSSVTVKNDTIIFGFSKIHFLNLSPRTEVQASVRMFDFKARRIESLNKSFPVLKEIYEFKIGSQKKYLARDFFDQFDAMKSALGTDRFVE